MNAIVLLRKTLTASPILAAAVYAGVVVLLLVMGFGAVFDLLDQRAAVASSAAMLAQLEGHGSPTAAGGSANAGMPAGSAFLEGATVTIAGAALLQRVAGAVTKVGGNVLSSQVDLQGSQSQGGQAKAGFISVIASCEIDQLGLQPLLYDLEAAMPFLFVDQLTVQAPSSSAGEGRLRILLAVSGQWRGAK